MRYLSPICLAAAGLLLAMATTQAQDGQGDALPQGNSACPENRTYIEPELTTRPEDGALYEAQRQAIEMPIRDVIRVMGGMDAAYVVAERTRASARAKLAEGARGAERRFHQDTLLRADALIAILDCLQDGEGA
ncbi:MAG: hypothetical protein QNJ06_00755 [Kiloniellales bacterium]|nr:hypothetical protein [Kiloniellales bacterium]MDJ0968398.1 hypothetical protein [Kiloniellales bacterium]MDJ0981853.1 hypothetical protein [Kiloniellales bacterium]